MTPHDACLGVRLSKYPYTDAWGYKHAFQIERCSEGRRRLSVLLLSGVRRWDPSKRYKGPSAAHLHDHESLW